MSQNRLIIRSIGRAILTGTAILFHVGAFASTLLLTLNGVVPVIAAVAIFFGAVLLLNLYTYCGNKLLSPNLRQIKRKIDNIQKEFQEVLSTLQSAEKLVAENSNSLELRNSGQDHLAKLDEAKDKVSRIDASIGKIQEEFPNESETVLVLSILKNQLPRMSERAEAIERLIRQATGTNSSSNVSVESADVVATLVESTSLGKASSQRDIPKKAVQASSVGMFAISRTDPGAETEAHNLTNNLSPS